MNLPQDVGRVTVLSYSGDVAGGTAAPTMIQSNQPYYGTPAIWNNVTSGAPEMNIVSEEGLRWGCIGGLTADGNQAVWWGYYPSTTALSRVFRHNTVTQDREQVLASGTNPNVFYSLASPVAGNAVAGNGEFFACYNGAAGIGFDGGEPWQLAIPSGSPAAHYATVSSISRSGNALVGYRRSTTLSTEIFLAVWRDDGSASVLSVVPPVGLSNTRGGVICVSGNGEVMGGFCGNGLATTNAISGIPDTNANIWINERAFSLATLLGQQGVNFANLRLTAVTGISDDGSTLTGFGDITISVGNRRMVSFVATILPPGVCDDIDFNRDGNRFDPVDIDAFLSVYSEGPCLPAGAQCRDIDFNNDGSLFDPRDIEAFLSVFSEGPCL